MCDKQGTQWLGEPKVPSTKDISFCLNRIDGSDGQGGFPECSQQYIGYANGDRNCYCAKPGGVCDINPYINPYMVNHDTFFKRTWPSCNADDQSSVLAENCECAPGYQGIMTRDSLGAYERSCIPREFHSGRLLQNCYTISLAVYDWLILLVPVLIN